jgi:hypothetical protein
MSHIFQEAAETDRKADIRVGRIAYCSKKNP